MINILFDCPNIHVFYDELKCYFNEKTHVCVIAFSYYDDWVYDAETWDKVFGRGVGNCYFETVDSFKPFGVKEENISFVNYFTDTEESAKKKIKNADVLYFTGGLPDRMMDRIKDFHLEDTIMSHDGIIMGYSAGAVIQLKEYHLYPDGDYTDFGYYEGLPMLDDFYLEVHYRNLDVQDESIKKCIRERGKTVYVTHDHGGGIVVENGKIRIVGEVEVYEA
jgi:peptidase E